jgi:hypothetical protein
MTRPDRRKGRASALAARPASRATRIREWIRPSAAPLPLRFNERTDDLLARLGAPSPQVTDVILEEAQWAYGEAAQRAESAERRATTIQGSVAIAASLTLAGSSLLLEAGKLPSRDWRVALGIGFALTVATLAMAAWRAFLVTWPRFLWSSPAAADIAEHANESTPDAIKLRRTSDLLVAYGRNDSIARLKIRLLGQAVRWLLVALALIAVIAALLAAYAIQWSPDSPAAEGGATRGAVNEKPTSSESDLR